MTESYSIQNIKRFYKLCDLQTIIIIFCRTSYINNINLQRYVYPKILCYSCFVNVISYHTYVQMTRNIQCQSNNRDMVGQPVRKCTMVHY